MNHFIHEWYEVDAVIRKHSSKFDKKISNFYTFEDLKWEETFFQRYEYIVMSIAPVVEQEKALLKLCWKTKNRIIAEKPIWENYENIKKICAHNNLILFLDELCAGKNMISNIDKVTIYAWSYDVFDHAIGLFLTQKNFQNINFTLIEDKRLRRDLNYIIKLGSDHILCNKWKIYKNRKYMFTLNFRKSLKDILWLDSNIKKRVKNNFLHYLDTNFNK